MKSMLLCLQSLFAEALVRVLGEDGRGVDPLLRPATDERHGDYQSNVAMGLAKRMQAKPRDLAQRLVDAMPSAAAQICEPFEIAGPGFINIRLKPTWLAAELNAIPPVPDSPSETCDSQSAICDLQSAIGGSPSSDSGTTGNRGLSSPARESQSPARDSRSPIADRLGIPRAADPQSVVVDYSSPNIAKQMHVGHLRSTIIGDTFSRVLAFQGHRVIRQNHLGDWGKQFGMLIAWLKEKMPAALTSPADVRLADLESFYREANALAEADPAFQEKARAEVVALHRGDPGALAAWRYIVDESRRHYMPIYARLGVGLTPEDERGESFYNDRLEPLVREMETSFSCADSAPGEPPSSPDSGDRPCITVGVSEGALCVWHWTPAGAPMFKNPEGQPFPMIIRKSDGAFIYATTDLAAVRFRIGELHADRIIYVTDARQAQHFEMLFATARAAGWTRRGEKPAEVRLEHASFGSILGEDRKPLKTRSGENIRLADLLDEAVNRAEALIRANEAEEGKCRGFTEEEIRDVAEAVGIGAVKYADLGQNRQSDYVFSWDRMLAMEGNTAPYMMYAYARIRSIYRKGAQADGSTAEGATNSAEVACGAVILGHPAERALALRILRFVETVESVAAGLRINLLTEYLYDLAGAFMKFYESCPVLAAPEADLRVSRLRLCDLAARVLRVGLDLLGIRVVERM